MSFLVHVLFKPNNLSNIGAQNQSLFKQCNFSTMYKNNNQETFPNQEFKSQKITYSFEF